ncbi:YjfB family protein [Paenibacillus puerhi]|uniref:YjfB family protein n=1 Tax=Paenibacillus puerhi TaxID=2692622 RepID=UPI0013568722|nr:YjfB family protein [Paenibacillus puerhi]
MHIQSALNAASSPNGLQQAVGLALLSKVKDSQAAQTAVLLQDFAAAQPAHLGKHVDIRA